DDGKSRRETGVTHCFRTFPCVAIELQMGNNLDERLAALRRSRSYGSCRSGAMGFASRMQRRAATNAVVYLSSADFPARIGMGSCVEDNARYSPIVERVCTRRIHSALLPPMSFVFLRVVLSVSSLTALAQEKSTPPPRGYPGSLAHYDARPATRLQTS